MGARSPMTRLGTIMTVLPCALFGSDVAAAWLCARSPGLLSVSWLLFSLYLLPPLLLRLHETYFPVLPGLYRLDEPIYCPWYGAHQIQLKFIAFPCLEAALRLVPGLYSAWLRLWGAKIGKGVYWTPRIEIVDRNLLVVGDRTIFGHHAISVSHVIKAARNGLVLYVTAPRIGAGVFIGAKTRIGPGAVIPDAASVPYDTEISVNERFCVQ